MPWKQFKQLQQKVDEAKQISGAKGSSWKWLLPLAVIFLSFSIIFVGSILLYQSNYQNKIYAGVKIGDLNLGGKTKLQAEALIQAKIDKLASEGITFYFNNFRYELQPIVSAGKETGIAYELWTYDAVSEADGLFQIGRHDNWIKRTRNQLYYLLNQPEKNISYKLNEAKILETLKENFKEQESPGRDAKLYFPPEAESKVEILPETKGKIFDYDSALNNIKLNLKKISNTPIEMKLIDYVPQVTREKSIALLDQIDLVLGAAPLTLSFKDPEYYQGRKHFNQNYWYLSKTELQSWLSLKAGKPSLSKGQIYLGLDQEKATNYLSDIAAEINTPAQNARFEIQDGKVSEWQSAQDGFLLNIEKTIEAIESQFIQNKQTEVKLVLTPDKSKISNENVNNLGINELVGVGESDFSGSPVNRRHNISIGAETLNGILIKPDEEFSLVTALGPIDAEAGYKPELVIREGRTVPEYGGGLCQIGTTLFRLAINTGLPVTERRNHSYRVSYYEPAGTDATIYNPWPDLKFINDTGIHLLLQTRIESDDLIFEFWGTSDGRHVATTTPVIYNLKAPPPAKYIETDELEPGQKRLIERAHYGADTHFERNITWPERIEREPIEEIWTSHYVPWQEVYLIGKTSTTTAEENINYR